MSQKAARSTSSRSTGRRAGLVAVAFALAGVLAACSSSGSHASTSGSGTSTTLPQLGSTISGSGSTKATRVTVPGTVRVVNLYAPAGKPQAIDIYDDGSVYDHPKPVVSDLAYGSVSKPFSLTVGQGGNAAGATIYGTAAGSTPTKASDFHGLQTTGFAADATSIVAIANNDADPSALSTDPLALTGVQVFYEADPKNEHGGPSVTAPAGKGLIAGENFAFQSSKASDGTPVQVTYFVDGTCAATAGNDTGKTVPTVQSKGTVDNFVVSPGSHTLQLFMSGSSAGMCSAMTHLMAKTPVQTTAGKVVYVFPYGTMADPKVLAVPTL